MNSLSLSFDQATAFVGGFMWPFMRIGAMLMVAPVFGAKSIVPPRIRLGIALVLSWIVVPLLPEAPAVDPLSARGLMISLHELLLGVAMGFILQLAFSSLVVAGQSVAMSMGLGFARFLDPTNGISVPVVSKFYMIVGTLIFLALNGHLVAVRVLVESFETLPIGSGGMSSSAMMDLVLWGGKMFAGALLIALPVLVTLQLIMVVFGVMMRASPQLNIFAIGFPTTMAVGFVVLMLTLPNLLPRFTDTLLGAFDLMRVVASPGG